MSSKSSDFYTSSPYRSLSDASDTSSLISLIPREIEVSIESFHVIIFIGRLFFTLKMVRSLTIILSLKLTIDYCAISHLLVHRITYKYTWNTKPDRTMHLKFLLRFFEIKFKSYATRNMVFWSFCISW